MYRCHSDVINHKTTKFESNSQHLLLNSKFGRRCYQSQNYKIWKQFTTDSSKKNKIYLLLSITKLQNLKQFTTKQAVPIGLVVMLSITKLQNLKAIHNSSPSRSGSVADVINHKTTKFESNSQHLWLLHYAPIGCNQSQNYKIWKQFTTIGLQRHKKVMMLSITKL